MKQNRIFKVVGRNRSEDKMPSYVFGKRNCIAKTRVYTSVQDYQKYSPKLIKHYKQIYDVEIYERINEKWVRCEQFVCDYQVYQGCSNVLIGETDDPQEVWDIIEKLPFGAGYSVGSVTGKDISGYIPF